MNLVSHEVVNEMFCFFFCFLQDNFGNRVEGEGAKAVITDSSVDRES